MKVILIIALIGIAISTKCSEKMITSTSLVNAYDTQYCRTLDLDYDSEKNERYYRCCYVTGKIDNGTIRGCLPLKYWDYGHVEDYNLNVTGLDIKEYDIHCNSKYLTVIASLIAFVFALF